MRGSGRRKQGRGKSSARLRSSSRRRTGRGSAHRKQERTHGPPFAQHQTPRRRLHGHQSLRHPRQQPARAGNPTFAVAFGYAHLGPLSLPKGNVRRADPPTKDSTAENFQVMDCIVAADRVAGAGASCRPSASGCRGRSAPEAEALGGRSPFDFWSLGWTIGASADQAETQACDVQGRRRTTRWNSPPGLMPTRPLDGDFLLPQIGRRRGCSSMVEQKLPKLTTRVRFPSPAPIFLLQIQCANRAP
jgi:hypothetical protein